MSQCPDLKEVGVEGVLRASGGFHRWRRIGGGEPKIPLKSSLTKWTGWALGWTLSGLG